MGRSGRAPDIAARLAISVLLIGCDTAPPLTTSPDGTPAATVAPATPTATPVDSPAPTTQGLTSEGWVAATNAKVSGAQFQDVVWTGQRFVAAGAAHAGGGVFVSSADMQRWTSVPSGGTTGFPARLAVGPNRVVAIGTVDERPASWISTDGVRWTYRVAVFPTALKDDDQVRVTDVVATATGWLAVGRDDPLCQVACGSNPRWALAWTSTDAEKWTRVPAQASLAKAAMNAVAAIDGGFVAVGDAAGHAAFWTSPDGVTWTRVANDPTFGPPAGAALDVSVSAVGVATLGGAIVAVGMAFGAGSGGAPIVLAWHSTDGRTWGKAFVDRAEEGQVFATTATTDRFLATGPSGATSCLGGIWASSDGETWSCIATDQAFDGFGPYAAAGSSTLEVAVGLTNAGYDENSGLGLPGAVWWRQVP